MFDKCYRFSLRKYKVGLASVAVGAFFLLSGGSASAAVLNDEVALVDSGLSLEEAVAQNKALAAQILEEKFAEKVNLVNDSEALSEVEKAEKIANLETEKDAVLASLAQETSTEGLENRLEEALDRLSSFSLEPRVSYSPVAFRSATVPTNVQATEDPVGSALDIDKFNNGRGYYYLLPSREYKDSTDLGFIWEFDSKTPQSAPLEARAKVVSTAVMEDGQEKLQDYIIRNARDMDLRYLATNGNVTPLTANHYKSLLRFNAFAISDNQKKAYAVAFYTLNRQAYNGNTVSTEFKDDDNKGFIQGIYEYDMDRKTWKEVLSYRDVLQTPNDLNTSKLAIRHNSLTSGAYNPRDGLFYFGTQIRPGDRNFPNLSPADETAFNTWKAENKYDNYFHLWSFDPTKPREQAIKHLGNIDTGMIKDDLTLIENYNYYNAHKTGLNSDITFDGEGNLYLLISESAQSGIDGSQKEGVAPGYVYVVKHEEVQRAKPLDAKEELLTAKRTDAIDLSSLPEDVRRLNGIGIDYEGNFFINSSEHVARLGVFKGQTQADFNTAPKHFAWGDAATVPTYIPARGSVYKEYYDNDSLELLVGEKGSFDSSGSFVPLTEDKDTNGRDVVVENELVLLSYQSSAPKAIKSAGRYYELMEVDADDPDTPDVIEKAPLLKADSEPEKNRIKREDQVVRYQYKLVTGDVVVNFVDEDGTPLKPSEKVSENAPIESDYDTASTRTGNRNITVDGVDYVVVADKTATVNVAQTPDEQNTYTVIDGAPQETGAVKRGTNYVTYVYTKAGTVEVNYVDENNEPIKPPVKVKDKEPVGEEYTTENVRHEIITNPDTNKVYKLVPNSTRGEENGTVTVEKKTVTYVYEEVKAKVTVKYFNEAGEEIKDPVVDLEPSSNGTEYDTADKKDATITASDGKVYRYKEVKAGSDPESGTLNVQEKTDYVVNYVYEEVKSDVTVNYVDENGNPIKPPVKVIEGGSVGTPYDTTEQKDDKIVTADGKVYKIIPSRTQGVENGTVGENSTSVTYVYEEVKGKVTVNYYNTDGVRIKGPVTALQSVPNGNDYSTEPKRTEFIRGNDGKLYRYKELQAGSEPERGVINVEEKPEVVVNYVYEEVRSNVEVNYVDEQGNEIKPPVSVVENAEVGDRYDATSKKLTTIEFNGKTYELVPESTRGQEQGTVGPETTTITYVYREVPSVNPPVSEQEAELTFKVLEDGVEKNFPGIDVMTANGSSGTPIQFTDYETKLNELRQAGYEVVRDTFGNDKTYDNDSNVKQSYQVVLKKITPNPGDPGNPATPDEQANGSVVVNYVDERGNQIQSPVVDTANSPVGTEYSTTDNKPSTLNIGGQNYVLIRSEGEETGRVTEGTKTVTYVFRKVGNWVPLIPGESNPPSTVYPFDPNRPNDPVEAIPNDPTRPNNPPVVPYVEGYEPYDPATNTPLRPKNPNDVTEGYIPPVPRDPSENTNIPYRPVPQDNVDPNKGEVLVNYKDTEGNTITSSVFAVRDREVGENYNTEGSRPEEFLINGERYVRIPSRTEGEETGTVTAGRKEVTYVYQKVASWVPLVPGGNNPPTTTYPFDPNRPNEPVEAIPNDPNRPNNPPVVPHVDGYRPYDPATGEPLKPKNPNDVTEGYIPPVPTNPSEDIRIPYEKVADVIVKYVDENGREISDPQTNTSNGKVGSSYDTTGNKVPEIVTADGSRYVLVPSKTKGQEKGSVGNSTTTVTYVYKKIGSWIPELPGENNPPKTNYPFDPTRPNDPIKAIPNDPTRPNNPPVVPYVDGYVPYDPATNTPLKPKNPNDVTEGYIPPVPTNPGEDIRIPYKKIADVIVKYVDENGKTIEDPQINTSNANVGSPYDTTRNKLPEIVTADGSRYVLIPSKTQGQEQGQVSNKPTVVTYVYKKIGSWIPELPGENNPPKTNYPFDPQRPNDPIKAIPNDPTRPNNPPVVPYVDGYIPYDPATGTPLKPKNPNDVTEGYIPPVPTNPSEDIRIPYHRVGGGTTGGSTGGSSWVPNTPTKDDKDGAKTPNETPTKPEVPNTTETKEEPNTNITTEEKEVEVDVKPEPNKGEAKVERGKKVKVQKQTGKTLPKTGKANEANKVNLALALSVLGLGLGLRRKEDEA